VNGRINAEIKRRPGGPPVPNEIAGFLDRLDGISRFSVTSGSFRRGRHSTASNLIIGRCVTAAAGIRDRMTVELRRYGEPGEPHFVIGKSDTAEVKPTEEILWDALVTRVYKVEAFTAAEAVSLFLSYWQTNVISQEYRLRALDL
jgi:hypothetical protein